MVLEQIANLSGRNACESSTLSPSTMEMEPIVIYYSVQNGGDGSAYPAWYLTEADAELDQEKMDEGWGESCTGHLHTYVGSKTYLAAVENSKFLNEKYGKRELSTINMKVLSYCDLPEELVEDHMLSEYSCDCYVAWTLDEGEHLDDWIAKNYPELVGETFLIHIDY